MFDLTGHVALVTGAGSADGIGFAAARALAGQGAAVALSATSERVHGRAAELRAIGATAWAATADLTEPAAAQRLADAAQEALGPLDVLINNAGMAQTGRPSLEAPFAELDLARWAEAIDRTLTTAVNATRAVLPGMLARGRGRVVCVSSVTGPLVAAPGSTAYGAAKAGMEGLVRGLALEAAASGVTVNAVAPGWIATASASDDELAAGRHTPVGRPGTPDEVAAAIVFLAAPESTYVTGQSIVVDGGNTIQEVKGG